MQFIKKSLLVVLILVLIYSCKDPSEVISGLYMGSVTINSSSGGNGNADVVSTSANRIDIAFTRNGYPTRNFNQVAVAGVEYPYTLSYNDAIGYLYGSVNGSNISLIMMDTSGVETGFTGTKY
jgi:hypothetical protein